MYSERLASLMDETGSSVRQLAECAGFDRTNISRLKSGRRIPEKTGKAAARVADALIAAAEANGRKDILFDRAGIRPESSPEEARDALLEYLYDGTPAPAQTQKQRRRKVAFHTFGERLDSVMTLAGVSNIYLSRLLHVDASLISRYRTGVRTPRSNPETAEQLAHALYIQAERAGRLAELAKMMHFPAQDLDEEYFGRWLFSFGSFTEMGLNYAEKFFETFDSYSSEVTIPLPSFEQAAPEEILSEDTAVYRGTEGLRRAVIRFLGNAVLCGDEELLLYSDQDMGWMTDDPSFRVQWASLMSECVRRGTHIRIIHNIDRDLSEMSDAIRGWLPLYMSGRIEPYYSLMQKDGRFSHTIFLSPGRACIHATHVIGMEGTGIYRYSTDPEELSLLRESYLALLAEARPLVRITPELSEEVSPGDVFAGAVPVAASMPEDLAASFGPSFLAAWKVRRTALLDALERGSVCECFPPAAAEALAAGAVPAERITGEDHAYTPQQYRRHLEGIRELLEECPSYRIRALPEPPFLKFRIASSENSVTITRTVAPYLSFVFTHPLMCRAFRDYTSRLMKTYPADPEALGEAAVRQASVPETSVEAAAQEP